MSCDNCKQDDGEEAAPERQPGVDSCPECQGANLALDRTELKEGVFYYVYICGNCSDEVWVESPQLGLR